MQGQPGAAHLRAHGGTTARHEIIQVRVQARVDPFDRGLSAHRTLWRKLGSAVMRTVETKRRCMRAVLKEGRTMLAWQRGHTPSRQASSEGVRLSGGPPPFFRRTIILPKRRQPAAASRFSP